MSFPNPHYRFVFIGCLFSAATLVGCAEAMPTYEEASSEGGGVPQECERAQGHVQRCFPDRNIEIPDSCDRRSAQKVLSKSCEELQAEANGFRKLDGGDCDGWLSWGCDDSEGGGSSGDQKICATRSVLGDYSLTGLNRPGLMEIGGERVFISIRKTNQTSERNDDPVAICSYPLEKRAQLDDQTDCFETEQIEVPNGLGNVDTMEYDDGKLYLTINRGLLIYDVSEPSEPELLGEWYAQNPIKFTDLEVHDEKVFLGPGIIFDVSDPNNISVVTELRGYITDWIIHEGEDGLLGGDGPIAYALVGTDAVVAYDVSEPRQVRILGIHRLGQSARPGGNESAESLPEQPVLGYQDTEFENGYLVVTADKPDEEELSPDELENGNTGRSGLWIFDVRQPANMRKAFSSSRGQYAARDAALEEGWLMLGKRDRSNEENPKHTVTVFDVIDPASPKKVREIQLYGAPKQVGLSSAGNLYYTGRNYIDMNTRDRSDSRVRNGVGSLMMACRGLDQGGAPGDGGTSPDDDVLESEADNSTSDNQDGTSDSETDDGTSDSETDDGTSDSETDDGTSDSESDGDGDTDNSDGG